MKKGECYTGYVVRVDFPNKAYVVVADAAHPEEEGNTVLVKNTIPGQKVRFLVHKKHGDRCVGILQEVLEDSPLERRERCAHFGICGGCIYQPMDYAQQLLLKKHQVEAILSDAVNGDYDFEGIQGSPLVDGYRNKMEFTFGDEVKGGTMTLGLHKKNSMYDIVPVNSCKIINEDYRKVLQCVQDFFRDRQVPFYHRMQQTGYLRHLLVRQTVNSKEMLIDLITTTQTTWIPDASQLDAMEKIDTMLEDLKNSLLQLQLDGKIAGILHTTNDAIADVVRNEGTDILYGQDFITEHLLGLSFKITPFSFFQTNSLGAEVLYSKVREYIGSTKDKVLYDLYSGTGTIAQILAPVAKKVVGVEIVEEAVEAARENAAKNGLTNCEFISGDVLRVIDDLKEQPEERPDLIVLDPPRDGIHPKALQKILDFQVKRMVYISCKPTSLARDLAALQERGYRVEKACCVDMFPGTVHVETVVLMSRVENQP